MLPLMMAEVGQAYIVKKVGGLPQIKKHLEHLGFVVGSIVLVVAEINGNLIVKVKETRVAISQELVRKIMV